MKDNIRKWVGVVRAAGLQGARHWYSEAHDTMQGFAQRYRVPVKQVVGACAALSPMVSWPNNLLALNRCLIFHKDGGWDTSVIPGINRNIYKAQKILEGNDPLDILGGEKVVAFYHNILDPQDPERVTIDRHAYRIWAGTDSEDSFPKRLMPIIQNDYREVAKTLGWLPMELQAATWVAYRECGGWIGLKNKSFVRSVGETESSWLREVRGTTALALETGYHPKPSKNVRSVRA